MGHHDQYPGKIWLEATVYDGWKLSIFYNRYVHNKEWILEHWFLYKVCSPLHSSQNEPTKRTLICWLKFGVQVSFGMHHRWVKGLRATQKFLNFWSTVEFRVHFVNASSQWEMMLQCNIISYWLGTFTKWSLWITRNCWYNHNKTMFKKTTVMSLI